MILYEYMNTVCFHIMKTTSESHVCRISTLAKAVPGWKRSWWLSGPARFGWETWDGDRPLKLDPTGTTYPDNLRGQPTGTTYREYWGRILIPRNLELFQSEAAHKAWQLSSLNSLYHEWSSQVSYWRLPPAVCLETSMIYAAILCTI